MRILFLLAVALVVFAPAAHSSADGSADLERERLAKVVGEIDYLLRRLDLQTPQADGYGRRYRFDYHALIEDLRAVRRGIVEYIERDLSLAREVPPLRTEYVIDSRGGH